MKVYKFGGGILRDSESIRKLTQLIQADSGPLVVVVSALDKTTQALENIFRHRIEGKPYALLLHALAQLHQTIIDQLLSTSREAATRTLNAWEEQGLSVLALPTSDESLDQLYSQVLAWGEWLSSIIIHHYLQEQRVACAWLDARDYVKTNSGFCDAQVDWATTRHLVQKNFLPLLEQKQVLLTQGFIGGNEQGETTTLGKEGSDFTGAILATALEADSLTIWKDVPGVMSADPKLFEEATKFDQLSYEFMGKMASYGAKVVHPKTIQPLAKQNIPLYVRPFHQPDENGTTITNNVVTLTHPVYVVQENQVLVQISLDNLAFFDEECVQEVTHQLGQQSLQTNLIDKESSRLTICLNNDPYRIEKLCAALSQRFRINSQRQVGLLTVLQQDDRFTQLWTEQKNVLLAQQRPGIYQAVFQS